MTRTLRSYWQNSIDLDPLDRKRLAFFIEQERTYYNRLVEAFAGPLRSMPDTFAKTASMEDLLGTLAEHAIDVSTLTAAALPAALAPYAAMIFDGAGRLILDSRVCMLAQTMAAPATLNHLVRRNIALAVLRECRAQSRTMAAASGGGPTSIIEALSPIERPAKRHVQVPRGAMKVDEVDGDLAVSVPYFGQAVRVSKPNASWNYAYARINHDGQVNLDLAFENAPYVLRKIDRAPRADDRRDHSSVKRQA